MKNLLLVVFLTLAFDCCAAAEPGGKPPFSHVYYLFASDENGCGDCYTPMIITRAPIDKVSLAKGAIDNVAVITYERDSIWQSKRSNSAG